MIAAFALGLTLAWQQRVATAYEEAAISDTSYAIPVGARFVATSGDDHNDGSEAAPWRTLHQAVNAAPSGSTIVMRAGTYREGNTGIVSKTLTIQPYPHERVWLKGSVVVTDWVAEGALWRKDGWTYEFKHGSDVVPSRAISTNPLAGWPDMVFFNGQPLQQVASKDRVIAGTFYVDDANNQLYVGSDPRGVLVEAAAFAQALTLDYADGSMIRGLGFMHYAPYFAGDQKGSIRSNANGAVFENNTFAWNAGAGISIGGSNVVIRGNTSISNGLIGIVAYQADNIVIERNYVAHNNTENFDMFYESGGIKVLKSNAAIIRDNISIENGSDGIWIDTGATNVIIARNVISRNAKHGIQFELSSDGIIVSNIIVANKSAGIQAGWISQRIQIYNNTMAGNDMNIRISGDWDKSRVGVTNGIRVKNNILSNGDGSKNGSLLITQDYTTKATNTGNTMIAEMDYNAYYRRSAGVPLNVISWRNDDMSMSYFNTLQQFRQAVGKEAHGISIDDQALNPFFRDEANGDYRLQPNSVAVKSGTPLPADVAAAVQVAAGVVVDRGALFWPGNDIPPAPSATPVTPAVGEPTATPDPSSTASTATPTQTPTQTSEPDAPTPTTPVPGNPSGSADTTFLPLLLNNGR